MQRERSEQLRSLSSVAGVMNGFAMSSLLQLNFDDRAVPYDGPASCGYAFTLGLTARPGLCKLADACTRRADTMTDSNFFWMWRLCRPIHRRKNHGCTAGS